MPFGKFKGEHIEKLPRSYLEWIASRLKGGDFHQYAVRAEEILKSDEVRREAKSEDIDRMADEFLKDHGFGRNGDSHRR